MKLHSNWSHLVFVIATFLFIVPFNVHAQSLTQSEQAEKVKAYFEDTPAMINIAECESGLRQYTDSGGVLRGGSGGKMIGVFQLHEDYHRAPALSLGLDIDTIDGNMAYAKYLFQKEGTAPWSSCLRLESPAKQYASATSALSSEEIASLLTRIDDLKRQVALLRIELLTKQVEALREILRRK